MLPAIKAWLSGLSFLGKLGVGAVTVATGASVAVPVATRCTDAPVTYESIEIQSIQPSTSYIKDGSLALNTTKIKTEGVNGEKKVKFSVTNKCEDQLSKTLVSEEQTKAVVDSVISKGTKSTETEYETVPYGTSTEKTSTLDKGVTQLKTAGVSGKKEITYEISQNEGEAEVRKVINEVVTVQPVTEVTYVGTYVTPPVVKQNCDPNYTPCVPNVSYDLDCPDIGFSVTVIGYDRHGFDGNDNDGYGCESY